MQLERLLTSDHLSTGRRDVFSSLGLFVVGCLLYGLGMGAWRSWTMGVYVAIKLPFCLLATLGINGLFSVIIAAFTGSGLGMRETLAMQLRACSVSAVVLGGFAPVGIFLARVLPSPPDSPVAHIHAGLMFFHTLMIAFAGVIGLASLRRILLRHASGPGPARWTMLAWLTGNFLAGSQVAWFLRPFFGSAYLPVEFLREDPFSSGFLESLLLAIPRLLKAF
ncbi:MAG: hypothetical protein ACKO2G_03645 [Verrucomicrobiales bacterium]